MACPQWCWEAVATVCISMLIDTKMQNRIVFSHFDLTILHLFFRELNQKRKPKWNRKKKIRIHLSIKKHTDLALKVSHIMVQMHVLHEAAAARKKWAKWNQYYNNRPMICQRAWWEQYVCNNGHCSCSSNGNHFFSANCPNKPLLTQPQLTYSL